MARSKDDSNLRDNLRNVSIDESQIDYDDKQFLLLDSSLNFSTFSSNSLPNHPQNFDTRILKPKYQHCFAEFNSEEPPYQSYRSSVSSDSQKSLLTTTYASTWNPANKSVEKLSSKPVLTATLTRIQINVSGLIFETSLETLEKYPNTLLGNADKRREYFDVDRNEYFFDRNRTSFESILNYYQSGGLLIRPADVPIEVFLEDVEFYQLGENAVDKFRIDEGFVKEEVRLMPKQRHQRQIWNLFEYPDTSKMSRVIAMFSVCIITASVFLFCIETLPNFQHYRIITNKEYIARMDSQNFKVGINETPNAVMHSNLTAEYNSSVGLSAALPFGSNESIIVVEDNNHNHESAFFIMESLCIFWFTVEFLIRFASAPRKIKFLCSFMNIIDIVSILPYFILLITNKVTSDADAASDNKSITSFFEQQHIDANHAMSLTILRVIRLFRIFRIFKLSRHSKGLQVLGRTLQASVKELSLLLFFILICIVFFSAAIYFSEMESEPSENLNLVSPTFSSIPDAFWWAIITMTTVGYGDQVPRSFWGKLIGSLCAIAGVLAISLPVPVIVSNFTYFYHRQKNCEERQTNVMVDNWKMRQRSRDLFTGIQKCLRRGSNADEKSIEESVQRIQAAMNQCADE